MPKPFARVTLAIGEALHVSDTNESTIEACRLQLERQLAALEQRALAMNER